MSSTPTLLERSDTDESSQWIDIVAPGAAQPNTGANFMIAINTIRGAIANGTDTKLVIDTDSFREIDDWDEAVAADAAARWDD